jgi:glutamate racemase
MDNPIGVFDSGIGGLTVVKQLLYYLPNEDIVYFGDTARVPYGTKSEKLIRQYALEDAAFLEQFAIKALVVACNSVSAVAVDLLQATRTVPVLGVIDPGVETAVQSTTKNKIGVIGTTATINSNAYHKKIIKLNPEIQVRSQPCPLLVSLVEEGWITDQITRLTIEKYLQPLLEGGVDTIILGCTHYPVLKEMIQQVAGENIILIDSGKETARKVREMLINLKLERRDSRPSSVQFYVSDIPFKFDEIGTRFLGRPVVNTQRIEFEKFLLAQGKKIYFPLNEGKYTKGNHESTSS